MFQIEKECYELVEKSLKELLILIIKGLKTLLIDQKSYKINWYLSGDLKFLALVLGINAANSYYPCIFCDSHKNTFKNTIHSNCRKFDSVEIGNLGFKNEPIIDFIKPENVIVDILHLFLRISDKLIDILISDLEKFDVANNEKNLKKYFDLLVDFGIKIPS